MQDLIQKKQELSTDIHLFLGKEFSNIKRAADTMVECATNIHGQGYSVFITSREDFFSRIDTLQKYIDSVAL